MSWIVSGVSRAPTLFQVAGTPSAAYSLRQLDLADQAVVRVRRSSDNTESDFTATQVSNGSLASWVGAGNNGFVRTWYDQSGNGRHAVQTTTASQPQIISSGSLILENSKPTIEINGVVGLATTFNIGLVWSIFLAGRNQQSGDTRMLAGSTNCLMTFNRGSASFFSLSTSTISSTTSIPGTSLAVGTYLHGPTEARGFINGSDRTASTALGGQWNQFAIGPANGFTAETPNARYFEVIVYQSNLSSARTSIESNINAHYAIY